MKKDALLLLLFALSLTAVAQNADGVLETARRVNNYFMAKNPDPRIPTFVRKVRPSNLWTRAVYYEGLMELYGIDKKREYFEYAERWAEAHKYTPRNGVKTTDADDQCCSQTYLKLYDIGQMLGFVQMSMYLPTLKNLDNQITTMRVDYWTWIDAIQMSMPVYFQAYQITKDRTYADYAMQSYRWTRNVCGGGLYDSQRGLWYRDKDFVPPYAEKDGQPCFWSRGEGWVYAALVRCMECLDKNDPYYKELKKDFIAMSEAIARCQREDGLWNVSMLSPSTFGGKEATGSSLFLYGISWGIRNKILKKKAYKPVCDRAWTALSNDCVHRDGFLGFVQGTGKQPLDAQPVLYDRVPDFEDFGIGCFLLGASQYYLLLKAV